MKSADLVLLHGLGGAKDLPIPGPLAIAGGVAALVVSFCVLALAWRTPRYDAGQRDRPLPARLATLFDSDGFAWALRLIGLAFFGYLTWALVAGPDLVTNPIFGVYYVWVWVGIVPLSLLFGNVVKAFSPARTIHLIFSKVTGGDPSVAMMKYPAQLGYWPGALGLFAFVWQELVNPDSAYLGPVRVWLAIYLAAMLLGAAIFGDQWFERADPFEVYSGLLAHLSPWGRRDGTLVVRSPLANLSTLVARPGLVAVAAILFGSTAFDSFKDRIQWLRIIEDVDLDPVLTNSLGLLAFCLIVGVTFTAAAMSTGVESTGAKGARRRLPQLLGHSVVPIIVGYMTAHYLSYLAEQGQVTLRQLSDPMVNGSNLLGTSDLAINYWISQHPSFLAVVQVLAVVIGHVVGVVAAHDRAIALLPKRHHVTGQIGMLLVMVFYTGAGLYLLFGA